MQTKIQGCTNTLHSNHIKCKCLIRKAQITSYYVRHNVYCSVTYTWPTISGMPRARSISCRAMTSAVLSRESSWSRSARSSLGPSLLVRGPSSSSSGCTNWSLSQQMRRPKIPLIPSSEFSLRSTIGTKCKGTGSNVYLFVLPWGLSIPIAESGQEGD